MNHLITGAAGFIGSQVCTQLLARGDTVVGVDNLKHAYDVRVKLGADLSCCRWIG